MLNKVAYRVFESEKVMEEHT